MFSNHLFKQNSLYLTLHAVSQTCNVFDNPIVIYENFMSFRFFQNAALITTEYSICGCYLLKILNLLHIHVIDIMFGNLCNNMFNI